MCIPAAKQSIAILRSVREPTLPIRSVLQCHTPVRSGVRLRSGSLKSRPSAAGQKRPSIADNHGGSACGRKRMVRFSVQTP